MAKTQIFDPGTSEVKSPLIAGLTEGISKISDVLNLETDTATITLQKVPITEDDKNRIYQAPNGKRLWLDSPAPVFYKNGSVITESRDMFSIDYVGGSISFERGYTLADSDIVTVRATYLVNQSQTINDIISSIDEINGQKPIVISTQVLASSWNNNTVTIKDAKFLSSNKYAYILAVSSESFLNYEGGAIWADNLTKDGNMTIHTTSEQENDLVFKIIRLEINTDNLQSTGANVVSVILGGSGGGAGFKAKSIVISTPPKKTTYYVGESFDADGMVVQVVYENEMRMETTAYTYEPSGPLEYGASEISVIFSEGGKTFNTTQQISVIRESVEIPSQKTHLTYNKSVQQANFTNYDPSKMSVSGATSGKDANTYTATFTLSGSRYEWSDGSTKDKTVDWVIDKFTISTTPSASALTYNGNKQTPTWKNYDSEQLAISGDTSGTEAKTYTAKFTPIQPNYQWSGGSTSAKSVTWEIKAISVTVPSVSGTITYDGNTKKPIWVNFDKEHTDISGDESGIVAKTYTATFTLHANCVWTTGGNSPKNIQWTIEKAVVASVPKQSTTLYYTGYEIVPTWDSYDPAKLDWSGDKVGVAVNSYTADFTPTSNYKWYDGGTGKKSSTWTISKAKISAVPTQANIPAYTGEVITPSWNGYDENALAISGQTSGVVANTYIAKFTPKPNYEWAEGGAAAKDAMWIIRKAVGTLSAYPDVVTLIPDKLSSSVEITTNINGKFSTSVEDDSLVDVYTSGNKIYVDAVGEEALDSGVRIGDLSVGTIISIKDSSEQYHDYIVVSQSYETSKNGNDKTLVMLVDPSLTNDYGRSDVTNFVDSDMYSYLNNDFLNDWIDDSTRAQVETTMFSYTLDHNSTSTSYASGKVFLLSLNEFGGTLSGANKEGTNLNITKYLDPDIGTIWTRTPVKVPDYPNYYAIAEYNLYDNSSNYQGGSISNNILPAFSFNKDFKVNIPLKSYKEGDIIQLNEGGKDVDFIVAKHNYSNATESYEQRVTLVVRKDCYSTMQFNSDPEYLGVDGSELWSIINSDYSNILGEDVIDFMYPSDVDITDVSSHSVYQVNAQILLLSATELGFTNSYLSKEGDKLPISDQLKVCYMDGNPVSQWTRSVYKGNETNVFVVSNTGTLINENVTSNHGVRPAILLREDFIPSHVPTYKSGETTITVSISGDENHTKPDDETIDVAVDIDSFPPIGKALNDCTWEEISKISKAGLGADYWKIGDCKEVTLNGMVGTVELGHARNLALNSAAERTLQVRSSTNQVLYTLSDYGDKITRETDVRLVVSAEVKSSVGKFSSDIGFRLRENGSTTKSTATFINDKLTTEWKKVTGTMRVSVTPTSALQLSLLSATSSESGTVYVRNVKLEYGTIATDWSSAPEDELPRNIVLDSHPERNLTNTTTSQRAYNLSDYGKEIANTVGTTLTVSCDMRSEGTISPVSIALYETGSASSASSTSFSISSLNSEWTRVSGQINVTKKGSKMLIVKHGSISSDGNIVYFRNMKLEDGNTATAWSPAPEDGFKTYVYILGFDHNHELEGTGITFGTFKTAQNNGTDIAIVDDHYGSSAVDEKNKDGTKLFNMNHWGTDPSPYNTNYGGWKGCDLRYDILGSTNKEPSGYGEIATSSRIGFDPVDYSVGLIPVPNTLISALPYDLRSVMKCVTKYTDNKGGSSNELHDVTPSVDYITVLSEFEVLGEHRRANQHEKNYQKQYTYFSVGNSNIKKKHDNVSSGASYFVRSPYRSSNSSFVLIDTSNSGTYAGSRYSFGICPTIVV